MGAFTENEDPPGWGVNFTPSQLSPSEVNFFGRRHCRIMHGQDPVKQPDLFTPQHKPWKIHPCEFDWPTDEEAAKYVKWAFAAYHNSRGLPRASVGCRLCVGRGPWARAKNGSKCAKFSDFRSKHAKYARNPRAEANARNF